jgi:hypothetical protein
MQYDHTATYDVEDDKIRIYYAYRLPEDEYEAVKKHGFQYAPKQGCFFAVWSPSREDLALSMAGEITPEGSTLVSRAEAKADRLRELADNSAKKSNAFYQASRKMLENIPFGQPILVGHHSERKHRAEIARSTANMDKAAKAHDMVDYWNYKLRGTLGHAAQLTSTKTRQNRIKTLLAELRGIQRGLNESHKFKARWEAALALKERDDFLVMVRNLCGFLHASPYTDSQETCYSALASGKMTALEVAEVSLAMHERYISKPTAYRWIEHLLNRVGFEQSQLGDTKRFEGELTPVVLQAFLREHGAEKPKAVLSDGLFVVESEAPLPAHICPDLTRIIALSDEGWRDLMQASGYTHKEVVRRVVARPAKAPLVNPTLEDAERLQAVWNASGKGDRYVDQDQTITVMEQADYTLNSTGEYAKFKVVEVTEDGTLVRSGWAGGSFGRIGEPFVRVRISSANYGKSSTYSVIHLRDAKAKPLGLTFKQS